MEARNDGMVDHAWPCQSMKNLLYAMLKGYVLKTVEQRGSNSLLYGMPTIQQHALEGGEFGQSP